MFFFITIYNFEVKNSVPNGLNNFIKDILLKKDFI